MTHLSPAECFILGRIAAARPIRQRLDPELRALKRFVSFLGTIHDVFDEFGLDRPRPPEQWWDRQDDLPTDVVWHEDVNAKRKNEFKSTSEGYPGVPSVALGLSPSEPRTLFLERDDGRVCGWRIERPRSGFFMMVIDHLRPFLCPSPLVWIMLHDGQPWPTLVEAWRSLQLEFLDYPHAPFELDPPGDPVAALAALAGEAGGAEPFRLGEATGTVDYELEAQAERGGLRPTMLKVFGRAPRCEPDDVRDALVQAFATLRSQAAIEAARADLNVAAMYHLAERELKECPETVDELWVVGYVIATAQQFTCRASNYIYGRLHAADWHP